MSYIGPLNLNGNQNQKAFIVSVCVSLGHVIGRLKNFFERHEADLLWHHCAALALFEIDSLWQRSVVRNAPPCKVLLSPPLFVYFFHTHNRSISTSWSLPHLSLQTLESLSAWPFCELKSSGTFWSVQMPRLSWFHFLLQCTGPLCLLDQWIETAFSTTDVLSLLLEFFS